MQEITSFQSLEVNPHTQLVTVNDPSPTISVLWDRAVQQAVINTSVVPTIASRAYSMVHTAIFDAWAAYDPQAISTQLGDDLQRPEGEITEANKEEAMSFAAYRVLAELFPDQVDIFNELMAQLGFDPNNLTTDTTTAAGIGNVSAEALLEFRRQDGSNQLGNDPNGEIGVPYSDTTGYEPVNTSERIVDLEKWTAELVPIDDPNAELQNFLTPQWGEVIPFGLDSGDQFRPPAPQPFLLVEGSVDLEARTITLEDGSVVEISRDLIGTIINPQFIQQAEEIVEASANLTNEQKLIAEFWEDSSGTSFPPGTWMTFGQFASARDNNSLDDDAKLFFTLGNAVFDAGVATWETKVFYDYVRPVRAIRSLGELGLIGEFNQELGGFAIEAWAGPEQGTQTILATDFTTYQTPGSHPSPPFAEYTSGHSSFSASGATILELFTDSDEFGATVTFESGSSRFEPGYTPQEEVTLSWDTFSAAADEAGISRIYGGIHFAEGDINGRILGQEVATSVFEQAQFYIEGGEEQNLLFGTRDADELVGTEVDEKLYGRSGNDILAGSSGNDQVFGGDGDDLLLGNLGDDILTGSSGNDILFGDNVSDCSGSDIFVLAIGEGTDKIVDFQSDQDLIGLANGLTFGQLSITENVNKAVIGFEDETLAILNNVSASELTESSFTVI